jgi:hypothetical protein
MNWDTQTFCGPAEIPLHAQVGRLIWATYTSHPLKQDETNTPSRKDEERGESVQGEVWYL